MASLDLNLLNSILGARHAIAASFICLFYDHILTLDLEIANVWRNPEHKLLNKVSFAINRYLTEAVVFSAALVTSGHSKYLGLDDEACKRFIWVFTISVVIVIGVSQFFINMRVYKTWETRASMNLISNCVFSLLIAGAAGLAAAGVLQAQGSCTFLEEAYSGTDIDPEITHYLPFPGVCAFSDVPKALPIMLGLLAFFDLFLILLAVYNGLEKPHQTNSDVLDSFLADGARLFVLIFLLRLGSLIVAVVGDAAQTFAAICLVFAINSNLVSRIHLRVEGLRFLTRIVPSVSVVSLYLPS